MIINRDFSGALITSGFRFSYDQNPESIDNAVEVGANFGDWVEFKPVQVTGIDISIPVTITGGEFRVSRDGFNFDDFSDLERLVEPNAWIEVRVRAALTASTDTVATLSMNAVDVVYTVTTWDGVYTTAKEVLKVSRSNDLVFLHDGSEIPETAPKHPKSRIFKGFIVKGLDEGETIISHSFLINDQEVEPGDTVDGLTFHISRTDGVSEVKAEISGGIVGNEYLLTLNYSTQYVPSDYRSQTFEVKVL